MIKSITRVFKFAVQNFFRNFWLSIATLVVLIITLLLVNVIISINEVKEATLKGVEAQVDIALDFKQTIPEAEVLSVRKELLADDRVDNVTIITPDENLERFTNRYPEIGEKVVPILDKNPLGYTLKISAFELDYYGPLLTDIQNNETYVGMLGNSPRFNDIRALTSKAATISEKINIGAIALAVIFLVIALIIVFNTIRVSIYTHREEIAIMQLVGATNAFIRLPFLLESIMYALVAVGILALILFSGLQFIQPVLTKFFLDFATIDLVSFYTTNFWNIFGIQFAVVALINMFSTSFALRRYL